MLLKMQHIVARRMVKNPNSILYKKGHKRLIHVRFWRKLSWPALEHMP